MWFRMFVQHAHHAPSERYVMGKCNLRGRNKIEDNHRMAGRIPCAVVLTVFTVQNLIVVTTNHHQTSNAHVHERIYGLIKTNFFVYLFSISPGAVEDCAARQTQKAINVNENWPVQQFQHTTHLTHMRRYGCKHVSNEYPCICSAWKSRMNARINWNTTQ